MMGSTMCKKEGAYTADTLGGVDSDDQPFVDAFTHMQDTFFPPDDCEGRLQQGAPPTPLHSLHPPQMYP
eukprot:3936078-Rhodomonas_salina.1